LPWGQLVNFEWQTNERNSASIGFSVRNDDILMRNDETGVAVVAEIVTALSFQPASMTARA
jgi:hypothetical protein